MTVSTTDSVVTYVSGGPGFPIPYRFLQNSDIQVVLVKQDGSQENLTGAQYTLTGAGAQDGGTLTSTYAASVLSTPGASLTISRIMDAVQPTDLRNQGKYLAETHEYVFDRLTMLIQQSASDETRSIRVPFSDPAPARLPRVSGRANKVMAFDNNGDPIAVLPADGTATQILIDLANSGDINKGAGMIGYGDGLGYPAGTVGSELTELNKFLDDIPAIGHPATESDQDDHYALTRRLHELHKGLTYTMDSNFELRALRGPRRNRAAQLVRSLVFSIPASVVTAVQWSSAAYDTDAMFSPGSPTRLTIPLNASVVRLTANVSFASNASGARSAYIYKNGVELPGCRVAAPAINGIATSLKVVSDPVRVIPGDYFEVRAYQTSGGALDVDVFSTFSAEILEWQSRTIEGKRMLITQGLYQDYENGDGITDANLNLIAQKMALYSCVVLSHVADYNNAAGCLDSKYDFIARLIRAIRNINPTVKIFGYIEGTASAPSGCGYANGSRYIDNGWTVPQATKEIERIQMWNNLPGARPDGIFIDLVSGVYMSAAHRDNIYAAIKGLGFTIMANTTYPSYLNVRFSCESNWFGAGDYSLMEGFSTAAGVNSLADTNLALAELALWRMKGIRMAALCSEAWSAVEGQTTTISSVNNLNAVSLFNGQYFRGDVYQYDFADLGIVSKVIQQPGIT